MQFFRSRLTLTASFWLVATLLISCLRANAALPGDEHWDNQFGPVGVNEWARAVTFWRGQAYVGGLHTAAGNVRATFIAGFDSTNWFNLNAGLNGDPNSSAVWSLAQDAQYLYAGGWFTNADNVTGARNIARWDGTNWSRMGNDLPGYVFALKRVGDTLYAGGIFATGPTNTTYNCLARWTGSDWEMIGGEFVGAFFPTVNAIETAGANLIVGGQFISAGGVVATNVARWNGSSWSALGSGVGGNVQTLLYRNGSLLAGGGFTNATAGFTNLAEWNGSTWVPWFNANRTVRDLLYDGTNLYVGGDFTSLAGQPHNRIAKWGGANWSAMGTGVQGSGVGVIPGVYKMAFGANGRVYAAGNFPLMGGVGASHVAVWDGAAWSGMGGTTSKGLTHFIGFVTGFLPRGSDLYVGGLFTEAGDKVVNSIAHWDGTNWSKLGSGMLGSFSSGVATTVRGMASVGSDLYVGGNFTNAGGVSARGVAKWNGSAWSNIGDSDALVRAMVYDGSRLFVGGNFTNIGGITSPGLAVHFPGGEWVTLGTLAGGNRNVGTITRDGTDIYIGGSFTSINGAPITNIARWNGSTWLPVGSGLNNTVNAVIASNGVVYAGGTFGFAGNVSVSRVARWNGSTWSPLGSGVSGLSSATINNFVLRGSDLYAAGTFTNAGGLFVQGLAKWDGSSWSAPFGSGLQGNPGNATVTGIAFIGDNLYVGGQFGFAGDKPSLYFARWNEQKNFYPTPNPRLINPTWLTNGQFRFRLTGTSGERYVIQSSSNLVQWDARLTNSVPLFDYVDPSASNGVHRSYRAVLQ